MSENSPEILPPAHAETLTLVAYLLPLLNPDPAVDVAWRMDEAQRLAYIRLSERVAKYGLEITRG